MVATFMASGLLAAGVCTDLICRRVPNQLILLGLWTGCFLRIEAYGVPEGCFLFCKDALLPMLFLYPCYLLGAIGAGDVKLVAAVSSMIGSDRIGTLILISFLMGAGIALVRLFKKRRQFTAGDPSGVPLMKCILSQRISRYETDEKTEETIPFTVCIGLAFFLINLWG